MHAAPSVTYPVGRSRFAGVLLALLWLAGLAGAVAFWLQSAAPGWRQGLAVAAVAAGGAFALAGWLRASSGSIAWDGAGWRREQGAQTTTGHPELALDLQRRMLLRWVPDGGRTAWLWVERNAAPSHWAALRRAVYSRANTGAPQGAEPPVAER